MVSQNYKKKKKKSESLQSVFHRLVAEERWEKSKKLWFQFIFFYFGFYFEFLIELLKKIKTLLFLRSDYVSGFLGLFIFVVELDYVSWFVYIC